MRLPDDRQPECSSRRRFLINGVRGAASLSLGTSLLAAPRPLQATGGELPRVAAINSVYRFRSHAYHIAGRFIHGYDREGQHHQPAFKLVRMYNDQAPENDRGPAVCDRHGIELCETVAEALGGERLDVDAVLLIIEHGDYPVNELGQVLSPRYELFQQVVEVFRKSGRCAPLFVDKHLSYDRHKALEMVQTARELQFGLMAGSSLPVTWRRPELELPLESPIEEGLVCYGGSLEVYFIHGLEALQCMLERRRGGETGVESVTCLKGEAVWQAAAEGRWSRELLTAALARSPSNNPADMQEAQAEPAAILVQYHDGTRGTVLNLPEQVSDFTFAARLAGQAEPVSTCFYLPAPPGAKYFDALVGNIEKHFANGRPPYPVERTLLTSTVLDVAMHSLAQGRTLTDPLLDVRYAPPADSGFFRGRYTAAG